MEKYDEVYNKYFEMFGEYYPNMPSSLDDDAQIAQMEECIATGKPVIQDTSEGRKY